MLKVSDSGEVSVVRVRRTMTDPELRRVRDMAFARMRAQGFSVIEIARYHRVSRYYVYLRLARMPEHARNKAEAI